MNKTKNYDFTIIVPVYNECENMERLEKMLSGYISKATVKTCVLMVNDGSTDGSLDCMEEMCRRNDGFYYISYKENRGLSTALKAGIDNTESRYVGYMDADMQTDAGDFELLLAHAADHQIVTGIRARRKDTGFKRLQSKIANSFRRRMTGDTATDTGCPLKVMWTDYAQRIPSFDGMHRFLPALFSLEGASFMEVAVRHYPRTAGKSKYHLWNRLRKPFADCIAFRWIRSRYIKYDISQNSI